MVRTSTAPSATDEKGSDWSTSTTFDGNMKCFIVRDSNVTSSNGVNWAHMNVFALFLLESVRYDTRMGHRLIVKHGVSATLTKMLSMASWI